MFDFPSVKIGRLFGITIEVNLSWIVIFVLVAASLKATLAQLPEAHAAAPVQLYAAATVSAVLFFASVVLHELSHSLVTRAGGGKVDRITLFMFGGVAQMESEPESAGREFLMAAAGPLASLLIAAVCFVGYSAIRTSTEWWAWGPLRYLAEVNLMLAIFNMLPGFPLDGGRVFRSIVWGITGNLDTATRWAARSGQVIGWGIVAIAALSFLSGQTGLIWFGLIGWFIAWLAGASYRQQVVHARLSGLTAEALMTPGPEYVDSQLSLEQLVHDRMLGGRHSRYPVMHDGSIIGIVTINEVKHIGREDWPFVPVMQVVNRDLKSLIVPHDAPAESLIAKLAPDNPGQLIVVRDGRMVGVVTRSDLIARLQ